MNLLGSPHAKDRNRGQRNNGAPPRRRRASISLRKQRACGQLPIHTGLVIHLFCCFTIGENISVIRFSPPSGHAALPTRRSLDVDFPEHFSSGDVSFFVLLIARHAPYLARVFFVSSASLCVAFVVLFLARRRKQSQGERPRSQEYGQRAARVK